MPTSSSSVMELSSELWNSREISFFHWVNRKFRGVSTTKKSFSRGREATAQDSGDSLAKLLGVTSPKIRMTTVSTAAEMAGPRSAPASLMNSTAPMVVAALLTMLFPIRMVDRSLSYWSAISRVLAARASPSSARLFSRIRFREVKAVSVAEK